MIKKVYCVYGDHGDVDKVFSEEQNAIDYCLFKNNHQDYLYQYEEHKTE